MAQKLFDKASLVMIPSQYKEGKIYNIKPEDQSSSFEFERGSAATRVNEGGGGIGDLFASEKKKGKLMSDDELNMYDNLIGENEDNESSDDDIVINMSGEKIPIKASNKSNKLYTKNDFKPVSTTLGAQFAGIHSTKGGVSNPVKVIKSKDLMDSVMSQSPVVSNFIDKQLSRRVSFDFEKMSKYSGVLDLLARIQ